MFMKFLASLMKEFGAVSKIDTQSGYYFFVIGYPVCGLEHRKALLQHVFILIVCLIQYM